ncbi:MAG TPA: hypothetical protein VKT21_01275 [Thermoplasmata archaeon]|nr:hypothetical protein [Thermoplasmata archaeon]
MKLKRTKSRTYKGRDYYRWTVQVHPSDIRKLGWIEGDELTADVRGETLRIRQKTKH